MDSVSFARRRLSLIVLALLFSGPFPRREFSENAADDPIVCPRGRAATICQPVFGGADAEQRRDGSSDLPCGQVAFGGLELGGEAH